MVRSRKDTPPKTGKPTLKTIAQLSGMAVPTVSRALGDAPDISKATKEKVRRIAREIGYVPNRAGLRLRTGRTQVISLVLTTEHDAMNMTSQMIASVASALRDTEYHLVVTPDFPDDDPLRPIRQIVETHAADAIIINRIQPRDPRVEYLLDRGFPFATHGRTIWADRHPYFDYDNGAFGRLAVQTLKARGHDHQLLIAPPTDQNYALDMIQGARTAAAEFGVTLQVAEDITSDSNRDAIMAHFANATDPSGFSGLISPSPNATMAAIAGLEAAGRVTGTDFDVFSKETVPFLTLFRPQILTAREDITEAAQFLAKAALQAIDKPDLPPLQHLVGPAD